MADHREIKAIQIRHGASDADTQTIDLLNEYASLLNCTAKHAAKAILREVLPNRIAELKGEVKPEAA